MSFDTALAELNTRLKAGRHRCVVERRGSGLHLRATLPERDDPEKRRQQRLNLELPATYDSLPEAERRALELGHQLRTGSFTWSHWDAPPAPVATAIGTAAFRAAATELHATIYRSSPERGARAWNRKWAPALRKLPSSGGLSAERLVDVVKSMPLGSATRRDQGTLLARIAEELQWDAAAVRRAARGYTSRNLHPRDIPADTEIETIYEQLRLPHWRWVWGMAATYGLRPHEIETAELTPSGVVLVADATKTGNRLVHPCHSRWVDTFELHHLPRPERSGKNSLSKAASDALTRAGVSTKLYNLRHAYALRLMDRGVPPEIGARLMGHSLMLHESTYKRWIQADRISKVVERYAL